MDSALSISVEPGGSFIRVTGTGLWRPAQVEAHFRGLDAAMRRMRASQGQARVLVDLTRALVQPADTAAAMNAAMCRIYRKGDMVAVICVTALLAMQVKHFARPCALATFADEVRGRSWLLAHEPA